MLPLCILLIKYYPQIGIQYNNWTGVQEFVGATMSKNMLGAVCLASGLFFFWDTLTRWSDLRAQRTKLTLFVNTVFIVVTWHLLNLSGSATSKVCLIFGCVLIAAAHCRRFRRHPRFLTVLVPVGLSLYILMTFGFGIDINAAITGALGRDSTFTGRTNIWDAVLRVHTNSLLGTGYDSFWLGYRLDRVWAQTGPGINEAHNGYLETYINLGLIGLFCLCGFLVASYGRVVRTLQRFSDLTCLPFVWWSIILFYNFTESAFKGQLMWLLFLLGAMIVARPTKHRSPRLVGYPIETPVGSLEGS
jgi:O-antigen ligase